MDFGHQILVRAHESVLFAGRHPELLRARQACSSTPRWDLLVRSVAQCWIIHSASAGTTSVLLRHPKGPACQVLQITLDHPSRFFGQPQKRKVRRQRENLVFMILSLIGGEACPSTNTSVRNAITNLSSWSEGMKWSHAPNAVPPT